MSTENSILLSIKPFYVNKIIEGTKTIELRRKRPKQIKKGSLVLIYATAPTKSIIGAFKVKNIIEEQIKHLWKKVSPKAAVSREEFNIYFSGSDIGYGIVIGEKWIFENPITLSTMKDADETFNVPQSFRYVTDKDLIFVEDELSLVFY